MFLAHKIELRPTYKQEQLLFQSCGVRRFTYNKTLNWWSTEYKAGNKPNKKSALVYLKFLKEEFSFIKDVSSRVSRSTVDDLEIAFSRFFKKIAKYPTFKKRGKSNESFSIREKEKFSVEGRKLRIEKLGSKIKMRNELRFDGLPKQVTISYKAKKWFASILVELKDCLIERKPSSVGVDLGINKLATLSDGIVFENDRPLKNMLSKLAKIQRALSRKIRFSNNWKKHKKKISKLHYYVTCKRKVIINEFTSYICKTYGRIVIEDLNVSGMMKNRKLSKAIADVGFYEIRRQLDYKSKLYNNELVIVDRFFPSSKLCSSCGNKKDNLLLKDRMYICEKCNLQIDRDLNASINLNKYSQDRIRPDLKCL